MHSIVYDAIHDEFVVPQQFGQAILTFRGAANGEEAPIRVIQGSNTQLRDPDRLDVDPVNNEIFVPHGDAVLVFPRAASGNVAPIRVLKGPDERFGAGALVVDPVHNLLIVAASDSRDAFRLMIFDRTAEGNAKPKAVIGGPNSRLTRLGGPFAVYPPTGKLIVSIRGPSFSSPESFVGVWSIHDKGDVPPHWIIGGPDGILRQPRGVALDPKNKSMIVSDKYLNAVLTFQFPEIF